MYAFIRICVVCAFLAVAFAEIPSYIKVCKRKDPEINKCVINSIENLRSKLKTGIPELNVPTVEPLVLDHARLMRNSQSTRFDLNITNLQIFGPSTFEIQDLNIDSENVIRISCKVNLRRLDFRGKYKINARILLLNLIGDGNLSGTFFGYKVDGMMKANKVIRNNKTYINFEKMKFDVRINKTEINFDNFFGNDSILGPASNKILNANSDLLVDEFKPVLENAMSDEFTEIANKITENFTYDELLPNN